MIFDPQPNDTIQIDKKIFKFAPHPTVPSATFGVEGRASVVYQLIRLSDNRIFALKVVKSSFQGVWILEVSRSIAEYATLPGLSVCQRTVLTENIHRTLIERYPALEYAVLMPWIQGQSWFDMIFSKSVLSLEESMELASCFANLLANLEIKGIAHCNIGGSSVIIDIGRRQVDLVDVEHMFGPGLDSPNVFPIGAFGYQHKTSRSNPQGQWYAEGDRFSGAIIIGEILGWHNRNIRDISDEDHFFSSMELQKTNSERYSLMLQVLNEISSDIAELFETAWRSPTLIDCPTFADWSRVIATQNSDREQDVSSTVTLTPAPPEIQLIEQVSTDIASTDKLKAPGIAPKLSQTKPEFGREIFISYAWGGESEEIVNQLDAAFQAKGITIVRDKRDLGFRGRIKQFMEQIGRGKCVIVVVSEKYLKSKNCMFELVQISRNGQFYDRIFPIVLTDANIYKPIDRIKYIKYWEEQIRELDEAIKGVGAANLQGIREDIDSYTEIRNTIAGLTDILRDMNVLTPEIHSVSGFDELFKAIERKVAE